MRARIFALGLAVLIIAALSCCGRQDSDEKYEAAVLAFMEALEQKDFDGMYALITEGSARETSKEIFTNRYKNIYRNVDAKNISVSVDRVEALDGGARRVHFTMTMDTVAGALTVSNYADVSKELRDGEAVFLLSWDPHVILPGVAADRPVRVDTKKAEMGSIYDRDGRLLAGDGTVKAVGIVVEKLNAERREEDLARVAALLSISVDALNEKISAAWVKEGLVVPIAELMPGEVETKEALLTIPGVRIDDKPGRIYPYGRAFSQEEKYLDRLKGTDGHRIVITDASGNVLSTLKEQPAVNGESIKLDISAEDAGA